MIPQAQTSPEKALTRYFLLRIYGGMYFKVPQSISGLKFYTTPLMPKSVTLTSWSLESKIFYSFRSLCTIFWRWQYETAATICLK